MSKHAFDRLLLVQTFCRERKIRRLDDSEFRVAVALLCLAGQSPVRGSLLIAHGEPVTPKDVAEEAPAELHVVKEAMAKLQMLGTLVPDETNGCLRFKNWQRYNPGRRPSDAKEATRERQRRHRAKKKAERDAAATPKTSRPKPVSDPLAQPLPTPPEGRRQRDQARYRQAKEDLGQALFPGAWNGRGSPKIRLIVAKAIDGARRRGGSCGSDVVQWAEQNCPELLELR